MQIADYRVPYQGPHEWEKLSIVGYCPTRCIELRATVDVPARCRKSKAVGAVFGLTCAKYQSGEIDRSGRISRCGDEMMRVMLYEATQSMLRSKKWSWLKAWAMKIDLLGIWRGAS